MRVLHIVNAYFMSDVHSELFRRLDEAGVEQVVFNIMQRSVSRRVDENRFVGKHVTFFYVPELTRVHKVRFFEKTRVTVAAVESRVDMRSIDIIHASTSNSDGAVALELHRRYGIPYIVAVRNTDLDIHGRIPYLWHTHREVLRNAYKVICITPLLRQRLLAHPSMRGMRDVLGEKSVVMPNGVNSFWLENAQPVERKGHSVLFVGKFDRNKNVLRLIEAVRRLRAEFPDLRLDLVGGDGVNHKRIVDYVAENGEWLAYLGKIYDRSKLKEVYRSHSVFAMVSLRETFGLVYIEALSQGLRLLYTKGQGIDGLFDEKHSVGEKANARSVEDIMCGLRRLLAGQYEVLSSGQLSAFDWNEISNKYIDLYRNMVI